MPTLVIKGRRPTVHGLRASVNTWGLRRFGRLWPSVHLGAPFAGVVAHHRGPSPLSGHGPAFHEATVGRGEQASDYFRDAGLTAFARSNGGLCTFRMGRRLAVYQVTNDPVVDEDRLAPSTDTNRELFGDFMGSLSNHHPDRPAKRMIVESTLGNTKFVEQLEPEVRRHAAQYLRSVAGVPLGLDEFALSLVAHVDSHLTGVLDLTQRPLTAYLASSEYGAVMRNFFDIASDVISKVNPDAMKEFDLIVAFVRDLLHANLESIAAAPETNTVRRHFALWNAPLTHDAVEALTAEQVKELGTVIVATYDTTALSLLWALACLESSPPHRAAVIAAARGGDRGPLSPTDLAALEAVRLGGSNPTALWRRTTAPFPLHHNGSTVTVPPGTMMWLDRLAANQDGSTFPNPMCFDLANIEAIMRSRRETVSSLLSRNRYEINSFSMINSRRNPRKCPGRLFSVRIQSILLAELYAAFEVTTTGIDTALRRHSSMPRPAQPGTVVIRPRSAPSTNGDSA